MDREKRFDASETRRRSQSDTDVTRRQAATMDEFLDKNQNIDRDLRRNPGLINNAEYLEAHPQLQAFLNQHPNVKEEITENPRYFMQRENRFESQEAGRRSTTANGTNPNPDLNRQEVATMDQFLDKNQSIDRDLRGNPGLVNNAEYLEAHPQLQEFLKQHPNVKEEIAENPRSFMQRENRFESQETAPRPVTPNQSNPNPDLNRQELASMDQFLDKNPNIERDLWRNPSMINNAQYLDAHPELQAFLTQHPNLKEEIAENPRYFMQRENRFESQETSRRAVAPNQGNPNPDLNRRELGSMDQFLDKNPSIERDLWRNPSMVNNAQYLEAHPELQAFLNQHPQVKEEIVENPRFFMQRENRFESRETDRSDRNRDFDRDRDASSRNDRDSDRNREDRDRDADRDRNTDRRDLDRRSNPNPDLNTQEVATMDDFLDRHPDVAKSLERKPDLVNNRGYLKRHKDLDEFLSEHPAVREEVRENPSYFMHRENQYEARNMDRDAPDRDRDRDRTGSNDRGTRDADADLTKKELQDMDRFLDKHKKIEKDLQKNPSLVNDHDYLRHHKSLETFLSRNPQVDREIRQNPSAFMRDQQRLEARNHRMNTPATKPKTKIEEKEQMHTATPH
jgi:phage-related protein